MQRYCKRAERKLGFSFPECSYNLCKVKQLWLNKLRMSVFFLGGGGRSGASDPIANNRKRRYIPTLFGEIVSAFLFILSCAYIYNKVGGL